jgi:hypothetical protein
MWTNTSKARRCLRLENFATFRKRTHARKRFINTYNTWMPTRFFKTIAQMLAAVDTRATKTLHALLDSKTWVAGTDPPGDDFIA